MKPIMTKVSSRICFKDRETNIATDFHNLNVSAFDAVNLWLPTEESQSQFIVSWGALIVFGSPVTKLEKDRNRTGP